MTSSPSFLNEPLLASAVDWGETPSQSPETPVRGGLSFFAAARVKDQSFVKDQ